MRFLFSILILFLSIAIQPAFSQVREESEAHPAEPAKEDSVEVKAEDIEEATEAVEEESDDQATEAETDSVAVEEEDDGITDPCYFAIYAIVRAYDKTDKIWVNNTKVIPRTPVKVQKPEGGSCDDLHKEIQKDLRDKIKERFGSKFAVTRKSVKVEEHTVYSQAGRFLKRLKQEADKNREKFYMIEYTY